MRLAFNTLYPKTGKFVGFPSALTLYALKKQKNKTLLLVKDTAFVEPQLLKMAKITNKRTYEGLLKAFNKKMGSKVKGNKIVGYELHSLYEVKITKGERGTVKGDSYLIAQTLYVFYEASKDKYDKLKIQLKTPIIPVSLGGIEKDNFNDVFFEPDKLPKKYPVNETMKKFTFGVFPAFVSTDKMGISGKTIHVGYFPSGREFKFDPSEKTVFYDNFHAIGGVRYFLNNRPISKLNEFPGRLLDFIYAFTGLNKAKSPKDVIDYMTKRRVAVSLYDDKNRKKASGSRARDYFALVIYDAVISQRDDDLLLGFGIEDDNGKPKLVIVFITYVGAFIGRTFFWFNMANLPASLYVILEDAKKVSI